MSKIRITVTVDEKLHDEASEAVATGRADSVSAWVGEAMADRLVRDRRLAALASLVAEYESEHGDISDEELVEQDELDRDSAAQTRSRSRARARRAG